VVVCDEAKADGVTGAMADPVVKLLGLKLCPSNLTTGRFLGYSISKNVVTLKSGSEVTQGHSLKVVPFDRLSMVFPLVFFSNIVPKTHRF